MQATPPLGAAVVTPLLARGELAGAAAAMAAVAIVPAVFLIAAAPGGAAAHQASGNGDRGGAHASLHGRR